MMRLTIAALLVASTVSFLSIGAGGRKAPAPPTSPFAVLTKCPSTPLEKCDFYLLNHQYRIPTLHVKKVPFDTILDKNPLYSGLTFKPVISANSYGFCYFIPETSTKRCGTSFYFKGNTSALKAKYVAERTTVALHLSIYAKQCVILPVANAKIQISPGNFIYLNPNDHYTQYARKRRCVIFNTTTP
eukprot:TRINITY_DN3228_c0_g2_i1.p1 TRINITY_DN3228_c0_g2~~TRINITY_DN3228_c0_g2_i1.p1  ORF type:complete len:187 (+),score=9.38 TRINITY_DN3228_c0_g2_i1:250-810(+)